LIFKAQALYNIGNHTGAKYYFGKAFEIDPNNELAKKIFSSIIKK
jgi:tetratricopeptide (TPR) repeat protein